MGYGLWLFAKRLTGLGMRTCTVTQIAKFKRVTRISWSLSLPLFTWSLCSMFIVRDPLSLRSIQTLVVGLALAPLARCVCIIYLIHDKWSVRAQRPFDPASKYIGCPETSVRSFRNRREYNLNILEVRVDSILLYRWKFASSREISEILYDFSTCYLGILSRLNPIIPLRVDGSIDVYIMLVTFLDVLAKKFEFDLCLWHYRDGSAIGSRQQFDRCPRNGRVVESLFGI